MNKEQVRDLVERAVWTFVQGAAAAFLVLPSPNFTRVAVMAVVAGGLSAVKNLAKVMLDKS